MDLDNIKEIDQEHHLQVYKRFPIALVKGKGSRVWDNEGKEYIDALAGIAVNAVGHCHPNVVKAIQRQAEQLIHISNFFTSAPQAALAKVLTKLSGMDRVFFANSGGEAVEAAIKLARRWGNKNKKDGEIISMKGCFHGRTIATIAAGKKKYYEGFVPMPPGYKQVEFNDIKAVKKAVSKKTTAVIIEPVQGEGGINVADKKYLEELRELCDKTDTLLIFDEVQCSIGRVGTFFAWQHFGVKPDILTTAKALGSGVPIGAALCSQKVADAIEYGEHGSTYGGNPLATAAALANIQTIQEENLVERAKELGSKTLEKLKNLAKDRNDIKEVRGLGLIIGIELKTDAKEVVMKMLEKGYIINATANNVIRLVPALNIPEDEWNEVLDNLFETLDEVKNG